MILVKCVAVSMYVYVKSTVYECVAVSMSLVGFVLSTIL